MTTVVVVDDHALIREGLRRAIERAPGLTAAGEGASVAEARALVRTVGPDVVVLDIRLPDGDGLAMCRELRDTYPALGVVILTMYGDDVHLLEAREAGAAGFVAKDAPARDVVAAVRRAAADPRSFSAEGLADAVRRHSESRAPALTERESQVLRLLAEGLSVSGISRRLYISDSTTKTHVGKIYTKLGASNRAQALMTALKLGLLPPSRP